MSDEVRGKLFESFEQGGAEIARKFGGTGLGLSICKYLVESMGGTIGVQSAPERGSKFHFTLKLSRGDEAAISAAETMPATDRLQVAGTPLDILVAEDSPPNQFLISRVLSRWGHNAVIVNNGMEAITEAQKRGFDVILMDVQMPVMDGPDAVRIIRREAGPCSKSPIIALTADAMTENHAAYLSAGYDIVVTKPVDWDELSRAISRLLPENSAQFRAEPRRPGSPATFDKALFDSAYVEDFIANTGLEAGVQIVAMLVDTMRRTTEEIGVNLRKGDLETARRQGHVLKGAAIQFGATQVADRARELEQSEGPVAELLEIVAELPDLTERSIAAMESYMARKAEG
jgi:CheY-like chemotaxis protein/HPt (histidine-containing phosphotransfer) domain-containing protein